MALIYTYNPGMARLFELEQQVRSLHEQLQAQRRKTTQVRQDYRKYRERWAESAADEINRSTRAYVERIRDLETYIDFIERNESWPPCHQCPIR